MAMTAAELIAYLRLDKSGFDRGLSGAEGQMRKTDGRFRDWAKGMGRATAETITVGAAAAGGLAATVFATGVNYNTLQQQSRAALETIMGGAEEANAQMDKLDEFATTSPFAKDVFIKAQQQLLGFGMEAENVVPTLSAIQDSVAAVGGSNQDIAEVANVLAKVTGTGKITAETFNELGTRGIDAATIIGEEMGKTGGEIRDQVTAGTLDADEAIAALTNGMTERFGGAAANVKDTMVGAFDRVKAATRDIGATMAEPFVDPKGGGLAVEWTNQFADALRAVERQTEPFVEMMMARYAPAFDNVSIALLDAKDAIDDFDMSDLEGMLDRTSAYAPAIAGLSGALLTMGTSNIPIIGRLATALGPIPAGLGAAAAASPEARDALADLWETSKPLVETLGDLGVLAAGVFSEGIGIAADTLSVALDVVRPLVDGFADLPEPIRNAATAAVIFNTAGGPMKDILGKITSGAGDAISGMGGWAGTFEGAFDSTEDFRAAVSLASESIGSSAKKGLRGAVDGVMGLFGGPWGIAIMGATALLTLYAQEQQKAKAEADELKASLDEQTGAFTAASEEIVASQLVEKIQDSAGSVKDFGQEMETYGLTTGDVSAAILDQGDALDHLQEKIIEANMSAAGVSDEAGARRLAETSDVWKHVEEQIEAHRLMEEAIQAEEAAQRERYLAMDESARANQRFQDSMREVADETLNTSDRVLALKDALDELEGGAKTQEERDRELATTQRDLNGWFEDNAEAIGEMDENLIDMSTGMPSHTELGNQLEGMLSRMGDSAHAAAVEIRDRAEAEGWSTEKTQEAIKEAYEPYISTLEDLEDQGYLTGEEVDALTDSIIGVPEVTAFAITHGDTVTLAELEVLELIDKIEATPDKDFKISDGDTSQEAMDILEDLGYDIETIEDGEFTVTPVGIDKAEEIVDNFVNKDRTITVTPLLRGFNDAVSQGRGSGVLKPEYYTGNARGGIDIFKGMAAGGVTGASVMDVAQFVPPGEIRYAGDRSDVDEAWIPLDGSSRSRNILEEAIRRMPNFELPEATGMAKGGVSGDIDPPSVNDVTAPDTSPLEDVWVAAMDRLENDTRSTFGTIHDDIATAQAATTATTASQMSAMAGVTADQLATMSQATETSWDAMSRETSSGLGAMDQETGTRLASMSSATTSNLGTMNRVTGAELAAMTSATSSNMSTMRTTTDRETTQMRTRASSEFESLRQAGSTQTTRLADHAAAEFVSMRTDGVSEATALKTRSSEQFTAMQTAGTTAARNLKDGLVSEISSSRSPFTGHVNDLVEVMRSFSKSLNTAYGDMGVDIGSPSRVAFASGGILPGYSPGRDIHRFYSPTAGQVDLSGGEAILRPEVTRAMGSSWVHTLNSAARNGGVSRVRQLAGRSQQRQAFADGGIIGSFMGPAHDAASEHKAQLPSSWVRPAGSSTIDQVITGLEKHLEEMMMSGGSWVRPTTGRVTSRYGAGRGAYPHAGMDIADGHGTPVVAAAPGRVVDTGTNIGPGRTGEGILLEHLGRMFSYYGHNPRGGIQVSPGDAVMAGQRIGAQGNTGNATGAHLHWEIHRDRAWADINPHPFWDAAGSGSSLVDMGTSGGSDRWAPVIRAALMRNGLPVTDAYVSAWLRQVQTESGGNPAARQRVNDINMRLGRPAEGLLQVIPPTFRAYMHPGHSNPFNPLDNALAAMAYAKSRYGVTGMLNAVGRGRGYQNGVFSAEPGWHAVGEYGPELVRFKGGESVRNNAQSRSLVSAQRLTRQEAELIGKAVARHGGMDAGVHFHNPVTRDTDELARKSATAYRRESKRLSRR